MWFLSLILFSTLAGAADPPEKPGDPVPITVAKERRAREIEAAKALEKNPTRDNLMGLIHLVSRSPDRRLQTQEGAEIVQQQFQHLFLWEASDVKILSRLARESGNFRRETLTHIENAIHDVNYDSAIRAALIEDAPEFLKAFPGADKEPIAAAIRRALGTIGIPRFELALQGVETLQKLDATMGKDEIAALFRAFGNVSREELLYNPENLNRTYEALMKNRSLWPSSEAVAKALRSSHSQIPENLKFYSAILNVENGAFEIPELQEYFRRVETVDEISPTVLAGLKNKIKADPTFNDFLRRQLRIFRASGQPKNIEIAGVLSSLLDEPSAIPGVRDLVPGQRDEIMEIRRFRENPTSDRLGHLVMNVDLHGGAVLTEEGKRLVQQELKNMRSWSGGDIQQIFNLARKCGKPAGPFIDAAIHGLEHPDLALGMRGQALGHFADYLQTAGENKSRADKVEALARRFWSVGSRAELELGAAAAHALEGVGKLQPMDLMELAERFAGVHTQDLNNSEAVKRFFKLLQRHPGFIGPTDLEQAIRRGMAALRGDLRAQAVYTLITNNTFTVQDLRSVRNHILVLPRLPAGAEKILLQRAARDPEMQVFLEALADDARKNPMQQKIASELTALLTAAARERQAFQDCGPVNLEAFRALRNRKKDSPE